MSYYTAATTIEGKGHPLTLGVIVNGGTVTVSMEMTEAGAGASADHVLSEDGIWTFYPGLSSFFTITPAGGAVFEITR